MGVGPLNHYLLALEEFEPLGLNTKTINLLVKHKIFTLQDLGRISESEIAKMNGIGPATCLYLKEHLRSD